jgi:hypothetical protein
MVRTNPLPMPIPDNSNVMVSSFKGKGSSAFLLNGNTAKMDWAGKDSDKFGGGSGNVSMSMDDDGNVKPEWTGGDTWQEPNVDTQNGFIKIPMQVCNIATNGTTNILWICRQIQQTKAIKTITEAHKPSRGSQLKQNSATVSHVNRDNFKLNAVYDVKIDCKHLKNYAKTNFTIRTVMSLRLAVPLAAMVWCETNKSVFYY